jgi:curved DNA-binding protein CbpA
MSLQGRIKSYYALLGLTPWANERQIRQAYRELSKLYHPDTTSLPNAEAVTRFREINDAYANLSNPERRSAYDRSIQFSRLLMMIFPANAHSPVERFSPCSYYH